ncbi:MAG TPA: orotidine-5'-phosphate decarboxylase [Candidatus Acidoferrum sp.]|nr:orotidine-5'-phosphate decarboxylase [Candidatus Acidoferrum sp.]
MRNPILVALDVPNTERALALAETLGPVVGGFKVGSELFTAAGPDIVRRLRGKGARVFLDLKFHDIPNTVAGAVAAVVRLDVQMLTVHVSGGSAMLRAAEEAAARTARELGRETPVVLGVTVLTSLEGKDLRETGLDGDVARHVLRLAQLGVQAGLRGLVCSPREVAEVRKAVPAGTLLVTPGIRAEKSAVGDQKRVLGAREALAAGADWLVIGRSISGADDPRAAAEEVLASLR